VFFNINGEQFAGVKAEFEATISKERAIGKINLQLSLLVTETSDPSVHPSVR